MMIYNEFLLKKGDEVICPSCRKNVFVKRDVPISKARNFVKCARCEVYVRLEDLQKVNNSEVKE
jgi:DNA-directed RNA polymerase subunit RPC12/RpoP